MAKDKQTMTKATPSVLFTVFGFHFFYLILPAAFTLVPLYLLAFGTGAARFVGAAWVAAYNLWFVLTVGSEKKLGRPWKAFENLPLWAYIFRYFPLTINRTVALDPAGLYFFGAHPHGALAFHRGLFGFATREHWDVAFPGLQFRVLAATAALRVPVIRELWLWSSCIDASKATARHALAQGVSLVVYPGGEREQMLTVRGKHRLFLKSRKGFVKLAIESGASLVPIFTFGETSLYEHWPLLLGLRTWLVKNLGVAIPLISGEFGWLPFRVPVTAVVGAPIPCQATDDVDEVHARYVAALVKLFNDHKAAHGDAKATLEIF
jgi:hypothetical protein